MNTAKMRGHVRSAGLTSSGASSGSSAGKILGARASEEVELRRVDNSAVLAAQMERLRWVKARRDEGKVRRALEALQAAAGGEERRPNLLELCVAAARARATVGEISGAMEAAWGRHQAGGD